VWEAVSEGKTISVGSGSDVPLSLLTKIIATKHGISGSTHITTSKVHFDIPNLSAFLLFIMSK
jgi:hypothetical protein